jgi:hypothetical protein
MVKLRAVVEPDKRSAWLRKLDEECPYQVVLPRQQLTNDSEILDFLLAHVGWFGMYVEDDYAAFVRYCFEDPLDAEIFRARFEPKIERLKLDSLVRRYAASSGPRCRAESRAASSSSGQVLATTYLA